MYDIKILIMFAGLYLRSNVHDIFMTSKVQNVIIKCKLKKDGIGLNG
jgi:hypothetical protein